MGEQLSHQPESERFKPENLDEIRARVSEALSGSPDDQSDIDERSYQEAVELLAQGGTDPGALMKVFAEARERYPDYSTGDGEREVTWESIDRELQEDHIQGMSDVEFTLATLVSELISADARGEDRPSYLK